MAGYFKDTTQDDAKASFTFFGNGIRWFTIFGPYAAKVDVYLDGALQITVDTWRSSTRYHWIGYQATGLALGQHTLELRNAGRNPASYDDHVYIDAVDDQPRIRCGGLPSLSWGLVFGPVHPD